MCVEVFDFSPFPLANIGQEVVYRRCCVHGGKGRLTLCVCVRVCVCTRMFETVAHQASLSLEFSRQEYWSGLHFHDLPDPGIEPTSPALQADSLLSEPPGKPHMFATWVHLEIRICYICR